MEMIDILQKLREYEEKGHNVGDAIKNVEKTNPTQTEGAVKNWVMDMEQDAVEMSREEFIKKHGQSHVSIYDRIQKEKDEDGPIDENKMKKESVNESITIATDSPQEASMMMQILKLAGVQPVDQSMINQPTKDEGCGCGSDCGCGGDCGDDCDCEGCAKKDETYANEPNTKTQSVDDLVNVHSGGLNRQKQQFAKAQDGDNAMAVETLANSLKEQYKAFKEAYQQEASKAKNPYAIGMAQAMKSTGDKPPLEKSTITKAHDIAKSIEKSEK